MSVRNSAGGDHAEPMYRHVVDDRRNSGLSLKQRQEERMAKGAALLAALLNNLPLPKDSDADARSKNT